MSPGEGLMSDICLRLHHGLFTFLAAEQKLQFICDPPPYFFFSNTFCYSLFLDVYNNLIFIMTLPQDVLFFISPYLTVKSLTKFESLVFSLKSKILL